MKTSTKLKKQESIHEHARRISELENSISELARCEHKKFEDYSLSELISTAENILDIMGDWEDDPCADRRELSVQKRMLNNFIKKWGSEER